MLGGIATNLSTMYFSSLIGSTAMVGGFGLGLTIFGLLIICVTSALNVGLFTLLSQSIGA